jgi:hypothetical protein
MIVPSLNFLAPRIKEALNITHYYEDFMGYVAKVKFGGKPGDEVMQRVEPSTYLTGGSRNKEWAERALKNAHQCPLWRLWQWR